MVRRIGQVQTYSPALTVQETNFFSTISWSDGVPVAVEPGTRTGIYVTGLTNGFILQVGAASTERSLSSCTPASTAHGEYCRHFSDGSAPMWVESSLNSIYDSPARVFTIDFASQNPGQWLTLIFRNAVLYDMDYGHVNQRAATLSGESVPKPVWIENLRVVGGTVMFDFLTQASRIHTVECSSALLQPQWDVLTTVNGDGNRAFITDAIQAPTPRYYRVVTR